MDYFKRFLFISTLLHLSLFLIWLVQNFLSPSEPISYQKAIRVDMIGLPDKVTSQEIPKPSSKANEKKTAQSEPDKIENDLKEQNKKESRSDIQDKTRVHSQLRPTKSNLGSSKISQLSALDKIEKLMEEEENRNKLLRQMVFKGNAIVDGNSLSGLNKIEAEDYVNLVEAHVRSFWRLPQWLAASKLRAKALVKWDSRGMPVLIQIIESSGNDEFDQIVMDTLQKAVPLPEPPEKFALIMRRQGVVFGFPE
jgi:colicin import membrane protein